MSYDGQLGFGLLGDYDALPELETIAYELERAIAALAKAASANAKVPAPGRAVSARAKSSSGKAKAAGATRSALAPNGPARQQPASGARADDDEQAAPGPVPDERDRRRPGRQR